MELEMRLGDVGQSSSGPAYPLAQPNYLLFSEQYLEKPKAVGDAAFTVTSCTFRGVPLIDDY